MRRHLDRKTGTETIVTGGLTFCTMRMGAYHQKQSGQLNAKRKGAPEKSGDLPSGNLLHSYGKWPIYR